MGEVEKSGGLSFERLDVWNRAVKFASKIYAATKSFPREELFGLTSQIRRAAVSVAANIAEGSSRSSGKDQARFFEMAFGSLNEAATILYIASDQGLIGGERLSDLRLDISDIGRMLSGLRRSTLSHRD